MIKVKFYFIFISILGTSCVNNLEGINQVEKLSEPIMSRESTVVESITKKDKKKINILAYIKDKKDYMGGYLGVLGTQKMFYASTNVVPDYDKLYWVVVKVLSRNYSCFMRKRYSVDDKMYFQCRDGRIVGFKQKITKHWAIFTSRQYDQYGQEIMVKNRKIIGLNKHLENIPEILNKAY